MEKAKMYKTFDELKSSEGKTSDYSLALKKHTDFERFIKEIMLLKTNRKSLNIHRK